MRLDVSGGSKNNKVEEMPPWENVLASISRLQKIIPDAVLVGGSAAILHAGHRKSFDHDHTVENLKDRFDAVFKDMESAAGWVLDRRIRPVLILGSLDGIETGIRNLIRSRPLETTDYAVGDITVRMPTLEETLRIKAYLALTRNAVRDYLDLVALWDVVGKEKGALALDEMDLCYPQKSSTPETSEWIVRGQLVKQMRQPEPFDLEAVDLGNYKDIKPPYDNWTYILRRCQDISSNFLNHCRTVLTLSNTPDAKETFENFSDWQVEVEKGNKVILPPLPGMRK